MERQTEWQMSFCLCWQSHSSFKSWRGQRFSKVRARKTGAKEIGWYGGSPPHSKPVSLHSAAVQYHILRMFVAFLCFSYSRSITDLQRRLELSPMEQISAFLICFSLSLLFIYFSFWQRRIMSAVWYGDVLLGYSYCSCGGNAAQ